NCGDAGDLITVTLDGAGNTNGTAVENKLGVISNVAISGTYAIAGDGTLTIIGGSTTTGGISADSNTFVLTQTIAGQNPSISIGIKQGQSNFTNASVTGTYKAVSYSNSGDTSDLLTLTF